MTREEAINHLGTYRFRGINHTTAEFIPAPDVWQEAMNMAIAALREQPQWISVEERLPHYGERVLITEGHAVFEASLSISHKWVRCGIGWTEGVTHWMPLPEPPEVEV